MSELSQRQRDILAFVARYSAERLYSPSIREICQQCRISSTSVVNYNLDILEGMGLLRRTPNVSRSIVLAREVVKA